MKNLFAIIALMLFPLIGEAQSFVTAQEADYKNSLSLGIGSIMISQRNGFGAVTELCPAVSLNYDRFVWKNLSIGAGYAYKNADPNAHTTMGEKIDCTEVTHALLATLGYKIALGRYSLSPYFAIGAGRIHFVFPDNLNQVYRTKAYIRCMISPGVKFSIGIKNWDVFVAYHYNYFECDKNMDNPVLSTWNFPITFGHHCFKMGSGLKF
mgnify:CR=1 FL=1